MKSYPSILTYSKDKLNLTGYKWHVSEKIDGTNVRVHWSPLTEEINFYARTDNGCLPSHLVNFLTKKFTPHSLGHITKDAIIFGEGYGFKIQNGTIYSKIPDVRFACFDILIDNYWCEQHTVEVICEKAGIDVAPKYAYLTIDEINDTKDRESILFPGNKPEGVILKSDLYDRSGSRITYKIKNYGD
jgi:ATP-dependent RNA circularization protein (DNA/RNA ligase family)